jgi:phage regulator Rha-like protein
MKALSIHAPITMSSLEIAELTGKRHAHVVRDISNMLDELGQPKIGFSSTYRSLQGKTLTCYYLPKDLTLTLITGYSIPLRHKINQRWLELEGQSQLAIPQTLPEALRLAASLAEERDEAIRTKAEIGSKREATAMNTAAQAVKKVKRLERDLDRSMDYCTIKRASMLFHGQRFDWRLLKSASRELGLEPVDVFDANYGTVKAYHADVWLAAYALEIE